MCILAGCDFLKALPGIGIKKAHAHIRKFKTFVRVRQLAVVRLKAVMLDEDCV